jgi:hypothetical protein
VLYAADKDFIWFDVPGARIVIFTVAPVTNTQTLLELYDEDGMALGVTGTIRLVGAFTSGGRYYLSVAPQGGVTSFGCADVVGYNLSMEMTEAEIIYVPLVMRDT